MNNSQQSYTLPDGEGRGGAIVFATNNKHKLSAPQKGINVVKMSDGTSKKVLVK
jgi:hypothetical protein